MAKLKGLGKGLDALLTASRMDVAINSVEMGKLELKEIPLTKIIASKYQPRHNFNNTDLEELAASIKANGVIQPILIRAVGQNNFEIVAGERRYRATKMAGLVTIPAIVKTLSDSEALAIALIENIQRKDLNVIEEAKGYKRLIDEFRVTHEDLSQIASRSRSHITNILRLLKLHPDVQDMLIEGQMEMGHARALLSLSEELQLDLAITIIHDGLTTSEVERRVAKLLHQAENETIPKNTVDKDPDIQSLETKIADKLGMMVAISHKRNGRGKITLHYNSLDELDNLLQFF
ncbi:MAG: ParB/RepB/Spo0J family partition protein [Burkholderiales bacterium]|nr:ParB/RepB/Spo0J family partition protein [Burkholderiales bacterium]